MAHFVKTILLFLLLCGPAMLVAQPSERKSTPSDYVTRYKDDAIREMQMHKVPASITLAQGMLESDNGNSALAVYANNHFGIKCHVGWTGDTYVQDDDDTNECFRKYPSVYDSYVDHSLFLKNRSRYAALFELKATDYKGWAKGLKAAGYATDPKYADRLIDIIERYRLYEYDNQANLPITASAPRDGGQQTVSASVTRREIFFNNNVKYVIVKPGDTFMKIAQELEMGPWQLYKYNELKKGAALEPGQMLYIQPKRKKSVKERTHTVKPGETMYDISQLYGVKVKWLYKHNYMPPGSQPKAGETIKLRK